MQRRQFLQFLAGATVGAGLLVPRRTFFLPPIGGWPKVPYASMIIPQDHVHMWAAEITDGKATYDAATCTMSWWAKPERAMTDSALRAWEENREWVAEPWVAIADDGYPGYPSIFTQVGTTQIAYLGNIQEREAQAYKDAWDKRRGDGGFGLKHSHPRAEPPIYRDPTSEPARLAKERAAKILAEQDERNSRAFAWHANHPKATFDERIAARRADYWG